MSGYPLAGGTSCKLPLAGCTFRGNGMVEYKGVLYQCSMEFTLSVIGGKWKCLIIWHLGSDALRFNELKRKLPKITQRMLTLQLRELESDGLVSRKVFSQALPKVEYSLTDAGRGLLPVLESLSDWARGSFSMQLCSTGDSQPLPGAAPGHDPTRGEVDAAE